MDRSIAPVERLAALGLYEEAFEVEPPADEPWKRDEGIAAVVSYLPERLLEAVRPAGVKTVAALMARTGSAKHAEAMLSLARSVPDAWSQAELVASVADAFPTTLTSELVGLARALPDEQQQAYVLGALLHRLQGRLRDEVYTSLLGIAARLSDSQRRARLVWHLVPAAKERDLDRLLALTREIDEARWRADRLIEIANRLADGRELFAEAVELARHSDDAAWKASTLIALEQTRPAEELPVIYAEAFEAIRAGLGRPSGIQGLSRHQERQPRGACVWAQRVV